MSPEYELLRPLSLGAQTAIVWLFALFFVALARSVHLQEVRQWAFAWVADAAALATLLLATLLPLHGVAERLALCTFAAGRTGYALLLIRGTQTHLRPGSRPLLQSGRVALAILPWSLALGLLSPSLVYVQIAMSLMLGGGLAAAGAWVLRQPHRPRSRWLAFGLLVEGGLFLHYIPLLLPSLWGRPRPVGYLHYSAFFDAGADLLVALAILAVMEGSTSEHLRHLNRELEASQERLRQLVDLDPLTSLSNRRRLREEFDRVRSLGAAIIFLDVDNFKQVNDRYGHIVGDSCLLRVATALGRAFRNDDSLFRLGGDEFLVVAPGLDLEAAERRVADLRDAVVSGDGTAPACYLSVGIAQLLSDGEPEAALREADDRMYLDKRRRKVDRGDRSGDALRRSGMNPVISG